MQLLDRIKKSEFLGREFLLWLWFRSEREEGRFDMGEDGYAELWFGRKIVLEAENDEGVEKVTCSGENPLLREARFALTKNKEITEAQVKLTIGDHQWSFVLDSTWLNSLCAIQLKNRLSCMLSNNLLPLARLLYRLMERHLTFPLYEIGLFHTDGLPPFQKCSISICCI